MCVSEWSRGRQSCVSTNPRRALVSDSQSFFVTFDIPLFAVHQFTLLSTLGFLLFSYIRPWIMDLFLYPPLNYSPFSYSSFGYFQRSMLSLFSYSPFSFYLWSRNSPFSFPPSVLFAVLLVDLQYHNHT
jgi:hypothetical protein